MKKNQAPRRKKLPPRDSGQSFPDQQLAAMIDRYSPAIAALARAALHKLRAQLPGAVRLVYDNYNALVIGFGPTERPSDAVLSLVLYPRWVNVCFLHGAALPDPQGLLRGTGKQVRNLTLTAAAELDKPAVRALIAAAKKRATAPFASTARSRLILRAVAHTRRRRRPAKSAD